MSSNLKIKLHEATQNNDGEDSYRFAKIIYTFKNPYGVKETFSDIVHFRNRIPVDSIKDEAIESFYEGMRVNGFIPVGQEDEHVVVLEAAYGKWCVAEYSDKDRPFKIDYTKYAKPGALRKFVTVVDVVWSNDMYDEFWQGNQYLIDQVRKRDKERDERGEYSEAVSKVLSDADRKFQCSMQKKKESLSRTNESTRSLGEVEYYEIVEVHKNNDPVKSFTSTRYRSADELYKALDAICGASTKGNLVVAEEQIDSAIEGYLDLAYADYDDTWVFRVWFTLKFTDPVATAIQDLGL